MIEALAAREEGCLDELAAAYRRDCEKQVELEEEKQAAIPPLENASAPGYEHGYSRIFYEGLAPDVDYRQGWVEGRIAAGRKRDYSLVHLSWNSISSSLPSRSCSTLNSARAGT